MSKLKLNTAAGGSITLAASNTAAAGTHTLLPDRDPAGASLVGYGNGTVQDVLDAVTGPTGAASVGYTPAGTGAVATDVQAKLRSMQVQSVADMLALPVSWLSNGDQVSVKGYHAGSVLGGGDFYWKSESTETANGGTVFSVAGVPTGRFIRICKSLSLYDFGAIENTDVADVMTAFFAEVYSKNYENVSAAGVYTLSKSVTIDGKYPASVTNHVSFDLHLTTTYSSASGYVITVRNIRDNAWDGVIYLNCGGTAYATRRNYRGVYFELGCSYAHVNKLIVYGCLHNGATIGASTQMSFGRLETKYCGSANSGTTAYEVDYVSHSNSGSASAVSQRTTLTVSDLPSTLAVGDYVAIGGRVDDGGRAFYVSDLNLVAKTVTVFPWMPNSLTAARLQTGSSTSNNGLLWAAKTAGTGGTAISIALVKPVGINIPLSVSVVGNAISVRLATGPTEAITTTAAQLAGAITSHEGASALVTCTSLASSSGSGLVEEVAATNLSIRVRIYSGCGLETIGNDSNVHHFGYLDTLSCGIGYKSGGLYGASIGSFGAQFDGIGIVTASGLSDPHDGETISTAYFEGNGYDIVKPTTSTQSYVLSNCINLALGKCLALSYRAGTTSEPTTESRSYSSLLGFLIFTNGILYRNNVDQGRISNTLVIGGGGTIPVYNQRQFTSALSFNLTENKDVYRLFQNTTIAIHVSGRGANGQATSIITVTPNAGYSINGGSAGVAITIPILTGPAMIYATVDEVDSKNWIVRYSVMQ